MHICFICTKTITLTTWCKYAFRVFFSCDLWQNIPISIFAARCFTITTAKNMKISSMSRFNQHIQSYPHLIKKPLFIKYSNTIIVEGEIYIYIYIYIYFFVDFVFIFRFELNILYRTIFYRFPCQMLCISKRAMLA